MLLFNDFIKYSSEYIIRDHKRMVLTDQALQDILDATPIVFMPKNVCEKLPEEVDDTPIELPFKSCFFEMDGFVSISDFGQGGRLIGLYVNEIEPRKYEMLCHIVTHKKKDDDPEIDRLIVGVYFFSDDTIQAHLLAIARALSKRFHLEAKGFCSPRTSIKIKHKGQKIRTRINRFVIVTPKKYQGNDVKLEKYGGSIDWSHRWYVRGHWRHIPGRIGKDREGNPQKDWTWVLPYEKGPEHLPLIKKARILKDNIDSTN